MEDFTKELLELFDEEPIVNTVDMFPGAKIYKVFHRTEGRYYALIVYDNSNRTTMSWARYLMTCRLGRHLTDEEEVDHKDDNKANDDFSNLQILTPLENNLKSKVGETTITKICPICGQEFVTTLQRKLVMTCSRRCGRIKAHL